MKHLSWDPEQSIGSYVDHFERDKNGQLIKSESFETRFFPDLKWEKEIPRKGIIPVKILSISHLFQLYLKKNQPALYKQEEIGTELFYKCTLPLFPSDRNHWSCSRLHPIPQGSSNLPRLSRFNCNADPHRHCDACTDNIRREWNFTPLFCHNDPNGNQLPIYHS